MWYLLKYFLSDTVESRLCSGTLKVSGSNLVWLTKRPECIFFRCFPHTVG
jgi:hypothetical protein